MNSIETYLSELFTTLDSPEFTQYLLDSYGQPYTKEFRCELHDAMYSLSLENMQCNDTFCLTEMQMHSCIESTIVSIGISECIELGYLTAHFNEETSSIEYALTSEGNKALEIEMYALVNASNELKSFNSINWN